MAKLDFSNRWVLVTGASSGLGREMARQLAFDYQANLFIVARREQALVQFQQEIESQCTSKVKVISADLSNLEEVDRLAKIVLSNHDLYGAILNAGITHFGPHRELEWAQFEKMVQLNVTGLVRLANQIAFHFEDHKKEGGLMVVSSMSDHNPVPYQAAYSGTKAFITNFANALHHELNNPLFSITVFSPGGVVTEMTGGEKFVPLRKYLMPVDQAARKGLRAFANRKFRYVPGLVNQLSSFFGKLLPAKFLIGQVGKVYKKALDQKS